MTPFGWRIASAVVGSLMVLVMIRLARRVTRSTMLGLVAGLLMCFDGLQLVLSRLALLDIFVAFFVLCAVSCMVADRDWVRARLARAVPTGTRLSPEAWGPLLLLAALAPGHGRVLGAGHRDQVVGAVPAGGLRPADVGLGRGRPPLLRRTPAAAEVGRDRRATRLGLRRAGPPPDLRGQLDRVAAARRRLRARPLRHPVRPLLGQLPAARRATGSSPSCGSRCARCGTTTTTSMPSTPGSSTTASTPTSRTRGAGWC